MWALALLVAAPSGRGAETVALPTGQLMSPTAAPGSRYLALSVELTTHVLAGFAQTETLSPDGKTLLVITAGFNMIRDAAGKKIDSDSSQFIFVFDVSGGHPVQRQVLQVPNAYIGLAFAPDGKRFYVPGAVDDNVHVFALAATGWAEDGKPIALGHERGNGIGQKAFATGIAITADGSRAVVANRYNDSVTIVDLAERKVLAEQDLRPGKSGGTSGTPGGQYPNSVAIVGNHTAYVSSELDREIVVVDLVAPSVKARIPVQGNPNKMVLDKAQRTLFVASDNADLVSLIDVASHTVRATVPTLAPTGLRSLRYKGASPDALALSPDERTLYVTNRGSNSLAVISLAGPLPVVTGLIPTAWAPSDVQVSRDGRMLYVSNAKTMAGPSRGNCLNGMYGNCSLPTSPAKYGANEYILNLIGSAVLSLPVPNRAALRTLTRQVASNNYFSAVPSAKEARTIAALRAKIKHVIYVIKENRTYDQVLGDLGRGNGDPSLTEFPLKTTPNHHALARNFVTLDNFFNSGDVSGNGWPWSTAARESDAGAKMVPSNYAGNGGSGDWFGLNRKVNVALAGEERVTANPLAATLDADTLPAANNVGAPDGPDGQKQQGYLWNAALRAGLSVRNYGCYVDTTRYFMSGAARAMAGIAPERYPFASQVQVAFATHPDLVKVTDPYYFGYDDRLPEFYRFLEWEREFKAYVASGQLPNLMLVRMMMDHTGDFAEALDGVNTPEIQLADNDYALGRLVQAVAESPFADSTLIFVVEDDSQDGPDHVDAHRGPAFVIGPYVKKAALVGKRYTTVNMIRTITDVLGLDHLGVNDATQGPMTDVFDVSPGNAQWSYQATASSLLKGTKLPLPADTVFAAPAKPTHDVHYWAAATRMFDFTEEDKVDAVAYNKVLWKGLMGGKPYPLTRRGK
ncbi:MAG: beta-propeller fold lactonase family protein [Pseudomonadota bacterium]